MDQNNPMDTTNSEAVLGSPSARNSTGRKWLAGVVVGGTLLLSAAFGLPWLRHRFTHSITDDAFIDAHLINIAPQVAGDVVSVLVQEQMPVKAGQVLAIVDPTVYEREVNLALARLQVTEAALAKSEADLALLTAQVPKRVAIADLKLSMARDNEARAADALRMIATDVDKGILAATHSVDAAQASFVLSEEDYVRFAALFKEEAVPQRRFEEATKIFKTAQADLRIAEAKLGQAEASRNQVAIAEQQLRSARFAIAEGSELVELSRLGDLEIAAARRWVAERAQSVEEARRALELARAKLDFTQVRAPFAGVIARKWRHLGDYAGTGEPIFSMYDPDFMYVTVRLEETLLRGVEPGNSVRLDVNAFADPFRGRVVWIGTATDGNFSLIPRDISSGEFTYVVQRVPVRVAIAKDDRWHLLKPGLSVRVAIEHGPGDANWAQEEIERQARLANIGARVKEVLP